MFSLLSTTLFMGRNGYRAQNGENTRYLIAGAQGVKVARECSKFKNIFGQGTRNVLNSVRTVAESDRVFNAISKSAKFASDHVNPLIACLSAFKVITAKDKQTELISESGNIAGMFIAEGWMAKNLDKYLSKLPISKKWMPVVRGIAFVVGSITASTTGQKITSKLAHKLKQKNEEYKASQEAKSLEPAAAKPGFRPKSVNYAA